MSHKLPGVTRRKKRAVYRGRSYRGDSEDIGKLRR